jgi:toprim domain protein
MAMSAIEVEKVIIVEGTSDKRKVLNVVNEPVEIICTNGTISLTRLDEMIDELFYRDVYVLVDSDESGDRLRKQFKRELPEAAHLFIDRMYREVATAPDQHVAAVLLSANIDVQAKYL